MASDVPALKPRRWDVLRCPRCDWAVFSTDPEKVDTLLSVHIQQCWGPDETGGRRLRVMVGNLEPQLSGLIGELIESAAPAGAVERLACGEVRLLEQHASARHFDACVLVLNNLIFPDGNEWPGRIEKALRFVTRMRNAGSFVIALAGAPDDPSFAQRVTSAGANHFLRLPFSPEEFLDVMRKAFLARS